MRQLLDLARENAALKGELTRIRREAEVLRRVLSVVRQTWAKCPSADSTADVAGRRGTQRHPPRPSGFSPAMRFPIRRGFGPAPKLTKNPTRTFIPWFHLTPTCITTRQHT